jgi:TatD DNase family protein
MKLIDVHCHLDETFYRENLDEVIQRARENNVKMVPAGINPGTNRYVLKLRERYPDIIFPSLGLYPPDALSREIGSDQDYDIDTEIDFIRQNKDKISAVGEVGMDFKDGTDHKKQEETFRKIIRLAMDIDKPLVIHSRKAESKVIEILAEYRYKKIVMHCFGGNHNLVKKIREHQWLFSIPTSIVRDQHFQKIVKETPMHLLLTETDSPFLSPFKEQRNEPSFVIETIKKISELKSLPNEDVANIIYRNAHRWFSL